MFVSPVVIWSVSYKKMTIGAVGFLENVLSRSFATPFCKSQCVLAEKRVLWCVAVKDCYEACNLIQVLWKLACCKMATAVGCTTSPPGFDFESNSVLLFTDCRSTHMRAFSGKGHTHVLWGLVLSSFFNVLKKCVVLCQNFFHSEL